MHKGAAAWLLAGAALAAGRPDVALDRGSAPAPPAASPALSRLLGGESLRVSDPGKVAAMFWLRARLPESKGPIPGTSPVLGERIAVRGVPPAAFVGFVSFDEPWRDYRDRLVQPGLYTARYLVQPAIKDHKGVSAFRDFLILTPADADIEVEVDPRDLIRRSAAAARSGHPLVMALFPLPGGSHPPGIFANSLGQPLLGVRIGSEEIGLVLEGHGRIEEV